MSVAKNCGLLKIELLSKVNYSPLFFYQLHEVLAKNGAKFFGFLLVNENAFFQSKILKLAINFKGLESILFVYTVKITCSDCKVFSWAIILPWIKPQ
jgi:hypothetical protein